MGEDWDIVVVGAGLTGINTACRLQTELPGLAYTVLEADDHVGGTWAFWRYPGFRTDSAMAVFGLAWHPWPHDEDFVSGPAIHSYLEEAAASHGLDQHIRLRHRVISAGWSSADQKWSLGVDVNGTRSTIKANFVVWCTGYYDYKQALPVTIPGLETFGGRVVHPQFWTDDVDYANKRVVLIGSGATAVTLLPELVKTAAHVTMLQRSPSYVFSLTRTNWTTKMLKRWLPLWLGALINWWRHIIVETLFVTFVTKVPSAGRKVLMGETKKLLPPDVDVNIHFNPAYTPFDQRLCFCPDGDFFKALHQPNCDIITDIIDKVTPRGIQLNLGKFIEADMIITATGLRLQLLNGLTPTVDGKPVRLGDRYVWRSCMIEGIPNAAAVMGYTAASWTPGIDARIRQAIRVIKHMRKISATSAVPTIEDRESLPRLPALPNSSTYIVAARDRVPLTTGKDPWVNGKNWFADSWGTWFGDLNKGMKYTLASSRKDD